MFVRLEDRCSKLRVNLKERRLTVPVKKMIRFKLLLQSTNISILRVDHHPESDHTDPEEEICTQHAINFVEQGSFGLATGTENWTLSPGYVFLSQPGMVHRYAHHERMPSDVCVSVIYSGLLDERHQSKRPPRANTIPAAFAPTNRLAFLKFRLKQLERDSYDLALEDWVLEVVSAIGLSSRTRLYREAQLAWYGERVEAVRELFETCYAEPHTLASTARSVGMSPFQFARVFSELVGSPPHQYLLRVRLDRAVKMLLDGVPVTETCFDVGFSNLSHFTRSFRRKFGYPPSLARSAQAPLTMRNR